MRIEKKEREKNVLRIEVSLEPSDYTPRYNEEINKQRRNFTAKGFRAGKAPLALVEKQVGHPTLYNLVNDLALEQIRERIKEDKIAYVTMPLLGIANIDEMPSKETTYLVQADFVVLPPFTLEDSFDYTRYLVEADQKDWNARLDGILSERTQRVSMEAVEESSDIWFYATPVVEGEEEQRPMPVFAPFSKLPKATQKAIAGKTTEFETQVDSVSDFLGEENLKEGPIAKEVEKNPEFLATPFLVAIKHIEGSQKPELNWDFCRGYFGLPETEEEVPADGIADYFKKKYIERLQEYADIAAAERFVNSIMEHWEVEVSEEFLEELAVAGIISDPQNAEEHENLQEHRKKAIQAQAAWALVSHQVVEWDVPQDEFNKPYHYALDMAIDRTARSLSDRMPADRNIQLQLLMQFAGENQKEIINLLQRRASDYTHAYHFLKKHAGEPKKMPLAKFDERGNLLPEEGEKSENASQQ